jgi:hypothetical protein
VEHQGNPYEGKSLEEIYRGLMAGDFGYRWPDEKLQKGYTGTCGVDLLRRAFAFVEILDRDAAFKPNWKGLDYGCGWGRFASAMMSKGRPDQFDLCDAWARTLAIINGLGYRNRVFRVSDLLKPGEIPGGSYDFIMSFSVFTHLSAAAFEANIPALLEALKPNGKLYLTVRHAEFIDHKYKDRAEELKELLNADGFVFLDSGGDLSGEKVFGDSIITQSYLSRFGKVAYLGQPHSLQHVYALCR